MSKKIKVAFYGSLRKGEYNYNSFVNYYGVDNYQYISTNTIKGFKLYSLGAYPAVIKATEKETENTDLIVDVFEVSPEVYESIRAMELGANYKEITITIGNEEVIMYEYCTQPDESRRVEHGDWSKFLAK